MRFFVIIRWFCVCLFLIVIAGCGGSDSSNDSPSTEDSSTDDSSILTGQIIDSPVCGLDYYTETLSGITAENGEYQYRAGETVVFGLGDLEFPAVTAAQIITPLELAGVEDITNTGVINMARLLQTLDNDCDPSNGIVISGQVLLATAGMSIDFESETFDEDVQSLIATESSNYSTCSELVDASTASEHLQDTLNSLNDQEDPPIGGGLSGKIGIWEGEGQQDGLSWAILIDISEAEQFIKYSFDESSSADDCEGYLTLLEETDAQLLFRETITSQPENTYCQCYDQGFVELTDNDTSSLIYRWYYPDSNDNKGELGAVGTVSKID